MYRLFIHDSDVKDWGEKFENEFPTFNSRNFQSPEEVIKKIRNSQITNYIIHVRQFDIDDDGEEIFGVAMSGEEFLTYN